MKNNMSVEATIEEDIKDRECKRRNMSSLMHADMAGRMLAVLSTDEDFAEEETVEPSAPVDEQIQFLLRNIDRVSEKDRKDIGMILVMQGLQKELQWSNQGTVIVLDKLSPTIINQMYQLLKHKIDKK